MRLGEIPNKYYGSKRKGLPERVSNEKVWIGKRKLFWKDVIGKVTTLEYAIRLDEKGLHWIDVTTGQKVQIPMEFSVIKHYTWAKLRDTFAHLTEVPPLPPAILKELHNHATKSRMHNYEHRNGIGEYIEHKPTGARQEEPDAPPPIVELEYANLRKYHTTDEEEEEYTSIIEPFRKKGYRVVKPKEADVEKFYIKEAPLIDLPFMSELPEAEIRLLEEVYTEIYGEKGREILKEKIRMRAFFKLVDEDRRKLKIDKIWAGKYQVANSKSKAKEYVKKRFKRMLKLGEIILKKGLVSIRNNLQKAFWTREKAKEFLTTHKKLYLIDIILTTPKEVGETFRRLIERGEEEKAKKLERALKNARDRTLHKLAYYQVQKELGEEAKKEEKLKDIKNKIMIIAISQKHITNSVFYGVEPEITELINEGEKDRYINENDPFSPHIHYHIVMLNAIKIRADKFPILEKYNIPKERIGNKKFYAQYYRISPYIDADLIRKIWKDELIRELKKYRGDFEELIKALEKYENLDVYVRYIEIMEMKEDGSIELKNTRKVFGWVEYVKRRPTEDIAKYFYYNNDEEAIREILRKYDPKWILYVLEYSNRTEPLGVMRRLSMIEPLLREKTTKEEIEEIGQIIEQLDAEEEFMDIFDDEEEEEERDPIEEAIEEIYGERGTTIKSGIRPEELAEFFAERKVKILIKHKIGKKEEYLLLIPPPNTKVANQKQFGEKRGQRARARRSGVQEGDGANAQHKDNARARVK